MRSVSQRWRRCSARSCSRWQRWQSAFRLRGRLFAGSWSRCAVAKYTRVERISAKEIVSGACRKTRPWPSRHPPAFGIPPTSVAEANDNPTMRPRAMFAAAFRPLEADHDRKLPPIDRIEPAKLRPDGHVNSIAENRCSRQDPEALDGSGSAETSNAPKPGSLAVKPLEARPLTFRGEVEGSCIGAPQTGFHRRSGSARTGGMPGTSRRATCAREHTAGAIHSRAYRS